MWGYTSVTGLKIFILICGGVGFAWMILQDLSVRRALGALADHFTEKRAERLAAEARRELTESRRPK